MIAYGQAYVGLQNPQCSVQQLWRNWAPRNVFFYTGFFMLNHELLAIYKLFSYKLAFSFFKWYAFQATYFLLFEMIPTEMKNLKKVTC